MLSALDVGRCCLRPGGVADPEVCHVDPHFIIKSKQQRLQVTCCDGCCLIFHNPTCWVAFRDRYRQINAAFDDLKGKQYIPCFTDGCPGYITLATIMEGPMGDESHQQQVYALPKALSDGLAAKLEQDEAAREALRASLVVEPEPVTSTSARQPQRREDRQRKDKGPRKTAVGVRVLLKKDADGAAVPFTVPVPSHRPAPTGSWFDNSPDPFDEWTTVSKKGQPVKPPRAPAPQPTRIPLAALPRAGSVEHPPLAAPQPSQHNWSAWRTHVAGAEGAAAAPSHQQRLLQQQHEDSAGGAGRGGASAQAAAAAVDSGRDRGADASASPEPDEENAVVAEAVAVLRLAASNSSLPTSHLLVENLDPAPELPTILQALRNVFGAHGHLVDVRVLAPQAIRRVAALTFAAADDAAVARLCQHDSCLPAAGRGGGISDDYLLQVSHLSTVPTDDALLTAAPKHAPYFGRRIHLLEPQLTRRYLHLLKMFGDPEAAAGAVVALAPDNPAAVAGVQGISSSQPASTAHGGATANGAAQHNGEEDTREDWRKKFGPERPGAAAEGSGWQQVPIRQKPTPANKTAAGKPAKRIPGMEYFDSSPAIPQAAPAPVPRPPPPPAPVDPEDEPLVLPKATLAHFAPKFVQRAARQQPAVPPLAPASNRHAAVPPAGVPAAAGSGNGRHAVAAHAADDADAGFWPDWVPDVTPEPAAIAAQQVPAPAAAASRPAEQGVTPAAAASPSVPPATYLRQPVQQQPAQPQPRPVPQIYEVQALHVAICDQALLTGHYRISSRFTLGADEQYFVNPRLIARFPDGGADVLVLYNLDSGMLEGAWYARSNNGTAIEWAVLAEFPPLPAAAYSAALHGSGYEMPPEGPARIEGEHVQQLLAAFQQQAERQQAPPRPSIAPHYQQAAAVSSNATAVPAYQHSHASPNAAHLSQPPPAAASFAQGALVSPPQYSPQGVSVYQPQHAHVPAQTAGVASKPAANTPPLAAAAGLPTGQSHDALAAFFPMLRMHASACSTTPGAAS